MKDYYKCWNQRPDGCTCEPPASSKPSRCPVHCCCMKNGKILYDPDITGRCRRCKNYPLYI